MEKFNGSVWTNSTVLGTGRSSLSGSGTGSNGLAAGGVNNDVGTYYGTTEKFTGQPLYSTYVIAKNDTDMIELESYNNGALEITCPAYLTVEIRPLANGLTTTEQNDLTTLGFLDDVVGGVWSNTGALSVTRYAPGGCGNQNAGLVFGSNTFLASTEKYSGSTWATVSGGTLAAGKCYLGGCGTQNAGLAFGGFTIGYSVSGTAEKFNGSTWVGTGSMNTSKQSPASCGTQNAAVQATDICEIFNGSTWTPKGSPTTSRSQGGMSGTQSASVAIGGTGPVLTCEKFNGAVWSNTGSLNSYKQNLASSGTQNSGLAIGGLDNSASTGECEKFNGAVWSITGSLNTAKQYLAGCGSQNSSLSFGGQSNDNTEKFNTQIATSVLTSRISY
jgi:hypothetical protein